MITRSFANFVKGTQECYLGLRDETYLHLLTIGGGIQIECRDGIRKPSFLRQIFVKFRSQETPVKIREKA